MAKTGILPSLLKAAGGPEFTDDQINVLFTNLLRNGRLHQACSDKNLKRVHLDSFNLLYDVGKVSLPLAIGLSMHMHLIGAIAFYPVNFRPQLFLQKTLFLRELWRNKFLLGSTGSMPSMESARAKPCVKVKTVANGYVLSGETPFMSMAENVDITIISAETESGDYLTFLIRMKNSDIKLGLSPLPEFMRHSGTCKICFNNVFVSKTDVIRSGNFREGEEVVMIYQRAWFQSLISAAYLGGAHAVLNELSNMNISENLNLKIGQMNMKLKTAMVLAEAARDALEFFNPTEKKSVMHIFDKSALAKYYGTHFAAEIVTEVCSLVKAANLKNLLIEQVAREMVFGPKHPMADKDMACHFSNC